MHRKRAKAFQWNEQIGIACVNIVEQWTLISNDLIDAWENAQEQQCAECETEKKCHISNV